MKTIADFRWLPFESVVLIALLTSCGPSKFSRLETVTPSSKISSIAVDYNSGILGEHLARIFQDQGYRVLGAENTYLLVRGLNLQDIDVNRPDHLSKLRQQGIDAYITCRSTYESSMLQVVHLKMLSTDTSRPIVLMEWTNSWGGFKGSPADAGQKKDAKEAADEIAKQILSILSKGG